MGSLKPVVGFLILALRDRKLARNDQSWASVTKKEQRANKESLASRIVQLGIKDRATGHQGQ